MILRAGCVSDCFDVLSLALSELFMDVEDIRLQFGVGHRVLVTGCVCVGEVQGFGQVVSVKILGSIADDDGVLRIGPGAGDQRTTHFIVVFPVLYSVNR